VLNLIDWHHAAWAVIAGALGLLGGIQGVCDYFPKDSGRAFKSLWCWLYLASRMAIPMVVAYLTLAQEYVKFRDNQLPPYAIALATGLAWEAFVRSRFYIVQKSPGNDILRGGKDLMAWYSNHFLRKLSGVVQQFRDKAARSFLVHSASETMQEIVETFSGRVDIMLVDEEVKVHLRATIDHQHQKFLVERSTHKPDPNQKVQSVDTQYKRRLAYKLLEEGHDVALFLFYGHSG
jgi:hypothetical protein